MSRWNLDIQDEIDHSVRNYPARTGSKKGGLSRFVDRAVRQTILWEVVDSIQE